MGVALVEREIHEIRQIGRRRVGAVAHLREVDKFAQDGVFHFELDAICKSFEGDVDVEESRILDADNGGIHEDHGQIDDQQL